MRTLVYYSVSEDTVSIRTYSSAFGKSDRFILLRKEIEECAAHRVIARDLGSFAELRILKNYGGRDLLQIDITWISQINARGEGKARQERIRIPYECIKCVGADGKTLSIEPTMPRIVFHSHENLKQVAKNPYARRQLSKYLRTAFRWPDTTQINLRDDFTPHGFYFESENEGRGCGCSGVVLYNKNNDGTGRYNICT